MKTQDLNFTTTQEDFELITEIMERGRTLGMVRDQMSDRMDITATHLNGCPLDLHRWLTADDYNFMHDWAGIAACLDRETAQLTKGFRPRFAAK